MWNYWHQKSVHRQNLNTLSIHFYYHFRYHNTINSSDNLPSYPQDNNNYIDEKLIKSLHCITVQKYSSQNSYKLGDTYRNDSNQKATES